VLQRIVVPLVFGPLTLVFLALESRGAQTKDDAPAVPAGMEVQARGPVHEAFAEPTNPVASPGLIVTKEPPAAIEEAPPEDKPEGDSVVWVPGYWAWDEEAKDYMWISGFWRASPPGRTWSPGHWQKVTGGYQWVAGYWVDPKLQDQLQQETEYLPAPPPSLERGPSTPAPAADYTYAPGIFVYQTNRYLWRPGYWVKHRPGWVWVSACYKWTPVGYVYVPGYWDVPLLDRGLLFAPVRFTRPIYTVRGFVYRPTFVVQSDFLLGSLFVSVSAPRFFFGDYFAPGYRRGYTAWYSYRFNRVVYDANYNYYRQAYVKYPAWDRGLQALSVGRFNGTIARPPRTWAQQATVINSFTTKRTTNVVVSRTVNLTNVQASTALVPFRRGATYRATGLVSLAGIKVTATTPAPLPVSRQYKVVQLSSTAVKQEKASVVRYQALTDHRRTAEQKLVKRVTTTTIKEPVKIKYELPKGTPPQRVIKTTVTIPPRPVPPPRPPKKDK
jgi:hypothetical protein